MSAYARKTSFPIIHRINLAFFTRKNKFFLVLLHEAEFDQSVLRVQHSETWSRIFVNLLCRKIRLHVFTVDFERIDNVILHSESKIHSIHFYSGRFYGWWPHIIPFFSINSSTQISFAWDIDSELLQQQFLTTYLHTFSFYGIDFPSSLFLFQTFFFFCNFSTIKIEDISLWQLIVTYMRRK